MRQEYLNYVWHNNGHSYVMAEDLVSQQRALFSAGNAIWQTNCRSLLSKKPTRLSLWTANLGLPKIKYFCSEIIAASDN